MDSDKQAGPAPLIDTFGRVHDNLRISVTDRCNIRCFYCMPEDNPDYVPRSDILTYEEIVRIVTISAQLGIRKLRLTGGEPLVRKDLDRLVRDLSAIPGITDLALTTNGILLADQAEKLRSAGLKRLNVHLDTLDRDRFRQMTRRDGLEQVLHGLEVARRAGFSPIKLNAVAVKGLTEPDVAALARFGRQESYEVRFIEYMPLDADHRWRRDQVLLAEDIIEILSREVGPLHPDPNADPRAPATEFVFDDGIGRIGIIASVSRPFCLACNRVRLTADGKLLNCLFARDENDLRALLRGGAADSEIADLIKRNVMAKWEGHDINSAKFLQPARPMHAIGG